ncbi:MAG: TerC family protein [Myxococcaceae bacterium]
MGTPLLWTAFLLGVVAVVFVDLRASGGHEVTPRKAAIWTGVWVSLSLMFAGVLYWLGGAKAAAPFLTAYVIEYALSVDNLFVFIIVFSYFKVTNVAQHRLLYWGIIGAFLLRGTLIFLGASLVARFNWVLYFFGAFLLFTAWKLLFGNAEDDEVDPENLTVLKWARRVLPVSSKNTDDNHFTTREAGKFLFTPLFLVLLVVESTDLLFALDSIPAVLSISQDPFIVFSSNACAILGLRSLFFLVSSLMDKFRYLKTGLGIILAFVGIKLIVETAFHDFVAQHEGLLIIVSLGVIAGTLASSIGLSVLIKPPPTLEAPKKAHEPVAPN